MDRDNFQHVDKNIITGATESDSDIVGESSSNYRAPCAAEDDAGSSSHSEVRSSSPGLADADADVEDSPSGSEETGSESERGGNSASNMYAPNTVGFPPSRSSLTHCIPAPGAFGSTVKFSAGNNPFAVKGPPVGSISSSNSSPQSSSERIVGNQSSNSFSSNSRIVAGRWGTCQPQPLKPTSLNMKPIIRPSALGSSLGGSGVTSSTAALGSTSFGGSGAGLSNFFDIIGADSSDQTVSENLVSSSNFVLRPPKLPFGVGGSSSKPETGFPASPVFGSSTDLGVDSTIKEADQGESELTPTSKEETSVKSPEPPVVFVPLAKEEPHLDAVSTSNQTTSLFSSTSGYGANSFASLANTGPTNANSNSASSATQSDSTSPFVFGSNLHDRVSNVEDLQNHEASQSANGISSSDGLFSAALRNAQGTSLQQASTSSQETCSKTKALDSQPGTSAFSDSSESLSERKRRFNDTPVITGEEDEFNVLQITCRLFGFDSHTSTWTERGRGQLRLNDRTESNNDLQSRIIVRTKGSLRLMLNTNVWSGMKVDRTSNKSVRFSANDNGQLRLFLVMATVGEADQFHQALEWRIKTLKASEDAAVSQVSEATSSVSASNINHSPCPEQRLPDSAELDFQKDDPTSEEDAWHSEEENEEDDENGTETHSSPVKKKRFIEHTPPPVSEAENKDSYSGFRPTPTILINNHNVNDLEDDET